MKIRKINFEDHSILGTLELDFTNDDGKVVDTIILAGENGVGKSVILNSIYNLNNFECIDYDKINFEIELSDDEIVGNYDNDIINTHDIVENWDMLITPSDGAARMIDRSFDKVRDCKNIIENSFKVVYSDVGIDFMSHPITNVTSKDIDSRFSNEISTSDLATQISQLIVDIQVTDALKLNEWVEKNQGESVPQSIINPRMDRFINSFNSMFPSKKYKGIGIVDNQRMIFFEENGRKMDINNLSSGEKQIVFRGSFLLKNKKTSEESIILIDEPEISLHPKWQLKILDFYKKLFTNINNEQTSQIIVSTHSPFIIHNHNRYGDKVIILKKDDDGKIIVSDKPKYYSWSDEELINEAFDISQLSNTDNGLILVEGEIDVEYFELMRDNRLGKKKLNFDGEIYSYGGFGAIQNTKILTLLKKRFKNIIITVDLDVHDKLKKNLNAAGYVIGKDYFTVGINQDGRDSIEGLLPDFVKDNVNSNNSVLIDAMGSRDNKKSKSAKNKLKNLYLEEFKSNIQFNDKYFGNFYELIELINKRNDS